MRLHRSGARVRRCVGAWGGALVLAAVVLHASQPLPIDRGAVGVRQKLLALQTTASVLHVTAHPDDEHGGMLAWLSRGNGVRTSLLSLTRGEAGDNAIGPELFDALGLIRTEELLASGRYYGVDRQYFTTAADYGFSKRLEEAIEKWGRDALIAEAVRVIRMERPLVIVSRFQGNARDGHGQHQAAGAVAREAFRAAGDPDRFPEQIAEGLKPWQPRKLYVGARESDDWTVRIDAGTYDPVLGDSYQRIAATGLSYQRSQNAGRVNAIAGSAPVYYQLTAVAPGFSLGPKPGLKAGATENVPKESGFFDGLDITPPAVVKDAAEEAVKAFSFEAPWASVPALARGIKTIRAALEQVRDNDDASFLLRVKERQFTDALIGALGIEFTAVASAPGEKSALFRLPTLGPVVAGQTFEVQTTLLNRSRVNVTPGQVQIAGRGDWRIKEGLASGPSLLAFNQVAPGRFTVTVPADTEPTRPYFARQSIAESHYTVSDPSARHRPSGEPALAAVARITVEGMPIELREPVRRREPDPPYGYALRELEIVPAVAVTVSPGTAIVPLSPAQTKRTVDIDVTLTGNVDGENTGAVSLQVPEGWTVSPAQRPFRFTLAGQTESVRFRLTPRSVDQKPRAIRAIARAGGKEFSSGYDRIVHRDLEPRYLYRDAVVRVRGIDVRIVPGLKVGYVMGIGDDVPSAIAQLGAEVKLLDDQALTSGSLTAFDTIVLGTRAYAVRPVLQAASARLLDYVKAGGNLVVFYNTQEMIPDRVAPYPASLPGNAEEVSEEDAPVEILQPAHPLFTSPNRITTADFDGWIEQRGSKFLATWDKAYTPLVSSHDKNQAPQQGGWVTAKYGKGNYTYFAYAMHRQVPYGVPGAYRILANLLCMGK
jgi:LmbE family N-acetylglucosaminyl deacetylase